MPASEWSELFYKLISAATYTAFEEEIKIIFLHFPRSNLMVVWLEMESCCIFDMTIIVCKQIHVIFPLYLRSYGSIIKPL